MDEYNKSRFSDDTRKKFEKLSYQKKTIFMNKDKKKRISRKIPLKTAFKKIFTVGKGQDGKKKRNYKIPAILIALFLLTIYVCFFTQFFIVKTVAVFEGEIQSQNIEIRRIVEPLRGKNIFLINTDKVVERLTQSIENLAKLNVDKSLPKTIKITYDTFKSVANITNIIGVQQIQKNFIINEIGIITSADEINSKLPTINIESDKAYKLNDQVISPEKIKYITGAIEYYEKKFDMDVTETDFLTKAREIHLISERGFAIWLDIEQPYDKQLDKLKNAIPKIDIYKDNLSYIDLRIQSAEGQKIIFKRR